MEFTRHDLGKYIIARLPIEGHLLCEEEERDHPHRPKVALLAVTALHDLWRHRADRAGEGRHGGVARFVNLGHAEINYLDGRIYVGF
jgi:hypothetical protein